MARLQQFPEEAYTTAELQKRFKISRQSVSKLIADGTFKAAKIGSGKAAKWIISARSVHLWLNGEAQPTVPPVPTPTALERPREIIALASLPSMDAEERAEIEARRESGELIVTYIDKLPALVPSDRAAA